VNSGLTDSFVPFLDSLTFKQVSPDSTPLAVIAPLEPSITASGSQFIKPPVLLYQNQETEVTIHGFRKKFLAILRNANHVATDSIADAILACIVGACQTGTDRLKFLGELVTRFPKAEVSHFLVLPHPALGDSLRFEGYCLGGIEMPVLRSRCRRAQSDYADLYGDQLDGRLCLKSPDFHHVVIDFLRPMLQQSLVQNAFWRELLLNYFELVSRQHFEFMWAHLDRTQVLSRPFGAAIVDVNNLRHDLGRLCDKVTIYLDFSKVEAGYVVPEMQGSTAVQIGSASRATSIYNSHRTTYRLDEVGDSELGRTLYACAGFWQQAIRLLEAGRYDDAALYATICLEHLFSEKSSTAEAVCTRSAVLTHPRLAANYPESEKELRKLYDARSLFVHSGKSVTPAQAERLIAYARETLRSLLVLHLKPENRTAGFLEKWVKDLDFIVAGITAGKTIDPAFLADCGILKP